MLSFKEITALKKSKKARDEQGLFVAEGRKLFFEAPRDRIVQVLMTREFAAEHPEVLSAIPKDTPAAVDVEEGRFHSLSDTKTPQGILTVMRKMEWDPDAVLASSGDPSRARLYCILENLQDPGNAGTILRTGEAAGVGAVFLTEGSVDLYSPKVIRSTMGAIFRVPHFVIPQETDMQAFCSPAVSFVRKLRKQGIGVYAAHLRGSKAYTDCDYRRAAAFVIGNESKGESDELAAECSELIRIPMAGEVESLNAALAAGILLYEAVRQAGAGLR